MNVSIGGHIALLCYSFFVGLALGALYDAVRLLRTFFGLGIDFTVSPLLERVTPPIIGKRKKKERRAGRAAAATAAIFLFDILYMTAATAVTVIFIYHASSGTPRGFALLGEAVGFILYMKTAGKLTAAAASLIFFAVDTVLRYIVYFTLTPLRFVSRALMRALRAVYRATVLRAALAAAGKISSAREAQIINKRLKKTLGEIALSVGSGGTER